MNPQTLEADASIWLAREVIPSESWRRELAELAPAPVGEEPHPAMVLRHVTAYYVAGIGGEVVPAEVYQARQTRLERVARSVLRQVPDIEGLPSGWDERHLNVQMVLDPSLAQAYDKEDQIPDKPIKIQQLEALANSIKERSQWSDRAACKGVDPNIFHPDFDPKVQAAERLEYSLEIASKYCDHCPVGEECEKFGRANRISNEPDSIYRALLRRKRSGSKD